MQRACFFKQSMNRGRVPSPVQEKARAPIILQAITDYNMTPIAYIDELRLNQAMHLMEMTSAPIESIIRESGFTTYTHFSRLFRRKTGLSPTERPKKIRVQPAGVI